MLEDIINKTRKHGKNLLLTGMITASALMPSRAEAQTATLTIDVDPTIGLGSEEVTDLTQFGAMFYTLGGGNIGFRIMYDPEHDGIANPEYIEMRNVTHLNPEDNILSDGLSAVPTGDINMPNRSAPVNMPGTPPGIQNLPEYLAWMLNAYPTIPTNNRGSPVTHFFLKTGYTDTQNWLVQRFVDDSNALYSTPLTELIGFSGNRPQSFDPSIDWEVVWKDLTDSDGRGPAGNIDSKNREIQLDIYAGLDYSIVLQEMGFGLYQGGFTMESANRGYFLDIDRQAPKVLFNTTIRNENSPFGDDRILYLRMFPPNYDSNNGDFLTGDYDPAKEIGYKALGVTGITTLEDINVENPVSTEQEESFGGLKARYRSVESARQANNHGRF